jgi:hypothetical protein
MTMGDREPAAVVVEPIEPEIGPAPPPPDPARCGGWARRRFLIWLAVVTAFGLGVRITYLAAVDVRIGLVTDASNYHLLADGLSAGHGYTSPFDAIFRGQRIPTAEFPPLHPVVLAVVSELGGSSSTAHRAVGVVLGSITVAIVGLVGRRLLSPAVGLGAAGLTAVWPSLVAADSSLMAETLATLLVWTAVLVTVACARRPSAGRFGLLGLLLGAATLTRGESALFVLTLGVPAVWALARRSGPGDRAWVRAGAIVVGCAAAVVTPWTIRNAVRLDAFVPVSNNATGALLGANCPLTWYGPDEGLWRIECFDRVDPTGLDEPGRARAYAREARDYAGSHVERLPRVAAVRLLRAWGLYHGDRQLVYEANEARNREWQDAARVFHWALLPVAAAGAVVLYRSRASALSARWPLAAVVGTACVTVVLTYGNQRFRLVAEPALLLAAATAIATASERVLRSRPGSPTIKDPGAPPG